MALATGSGQEALIKDECGFLIPGCWVQGLKRVRGSPALRQHPQDQGLLGEVKGTATALLSWVCGFLKVSG